MSKATIKLEGYEANCAFAKAHRHAAVLAASRKKAELYSNKETSSSSSYCIGEQEEVDGQVCSSCRGL